MSKPNRSKEFSNHAIALSLLSESERKIAEQQLITDILKSNNISPKRYITFADKMAESDRKRNETWNQIKDLGWFIMLLVVIPVSYYAINWIQSWK